MTEITVAEAYLALLKARGVDVLFANPGTDFAPIVEAYARAGETGLDFPTPHTIVHETVAVGMADGYWQVSGRMAAVMAHVNVGTANALMGLINARRDNVPIFMAAGRSPVTEKGRKGARDRGIHWGQEMFDQAGMLREAVKWDYELRLADQLEAVVERALAIAATPPMGPVYFTMPREIMAEPLPDFRLSPESRQKPVSVGLPDPAAIAAAASVLSAAERPAIVANRGAGWQVLADFAERFAMPVVEFWASRASLPGDHPMHGGFDPGPWLADADAVLVLDAMVPWMPVEQDILPGCKVVQVGPDPLFSDVPVRGFPADVAVAGDPAAVLEALSAEMAPAPKGRGADVARRCREAREARLAAAEAGGTARPMAPGWVSRCLDRALPDDAMIFNELGAPMAALTVRDPLGYFGGSLAGGLGWGLPAALGAKLARPERLAVACVGDGSYMFANPVACHQASAGLGLPVLTLVFNNGIYNAVRRAALSVYPDGHASRANVMPLTSLDPAPRYDLIVQASGGHGERVEDPEVLPDALSRAIEVVTGEGRQALLDIAVGVP